jgi:hypothetical protein
MQRISLALLAVLACLTPGPVFASACSNPNGNEADEIYNYAYHTKQFCNGSAWIAEGAAGGSGGPQLISTQTASSSASLQFTNLPTSYNTLFLNCTGLITSGGGSSYISFLVGEGSGGSFAWDTTSNYTVSYIGTYQGGTPDTDYQTNATDLTGGVGYGSGTTIPASIKMYIDDVGSSSVVKLATWQDSIAGEQWYISGTGFWNVDTNPITGLKLVPSAGTMSGTCSLYGMN